MDAVLDNVMEEQADYQGAIESLREYITKSGKTQTAVGTELGLSSGAVSAFLSGKYKTPHTIIPKVRALISMHEKKAVAPKAPDFAETSISRAIHNTIAYAHLRGVISVVYGDAGVGKTSTVREYVKNDSLALLITISPTYSSITGVNELIAAQLGVRDRVARRLTAEIVDRLRGSGRVLIVDEAQHLTVRALNHLRCISDESGIGIALVGNEEVYSKLRGSGKEEFAQLFSRIGMRKQVQTRDITREDIKSIFGKYELDEGVLKLLGGVANTPYGLRGAVNVYINTAAVYGEVNEKGIVKVMRDMNIG
ncbi:MAG: AAA family ATPase [Lachnospiraceae bacterium]|nr:AAA family ATPase [Lachnospiraceae bacterium]